MPPIAEPRATPPVCPKCGAALAEPKPDLCPQCGAALRVKLPRQVHLVGGLIGCFAYLAVILGGLGALLSVGTIESAPASWEEVSQWLWGSASCAFAAVLLFCWSYWINRKPK